MQYTISNGILEITVTDDGAELISVKKNGKERVWQNPTGEWAGHAPLLFPVCGHCGLTFDGKSYPIKAHGFAKRSKFTLEEQTPTSLTFSISATQETLAVYPFEFKFSVKYQIENATLTVSFTVENPAKTPLWFACGSHESYALDCNVDGYELAFEKDEKFVHYYHDDKGYMTGESKDYGFGTVLPLPYDLLQNGNTLILKDIRSRKVDLRKKDGERVASITFEGFSNLLVWRADDARFICVEPWTNLPDPANTPDIEFSKKGGVIKVDGGDCKTLVHTITY